MIKRNSSGTVLSTIGVGAIAIYREQINSQNSGDAVFEYNIISDPVIVEITGKAVFEEFETKEVPKKIEFKCNPDSCYTILSDLINPEIYFRIKNFYNDILDNCLGKATSEQHDYVFRFNEPNSMRPLASGLIEESEKYIRNLPESSNRANLEDLIGQIISGLLEYAFHAKDEYGVKMHQYAIALKKKL